MVGSIHTARKAVAVFEDYDQWRVDNWNSDYSKDGFRFVGEGCTRTAFLHLASAIVYKIGSNAYNVAEAQASKKFRGWHMMHGHSVMIPPVTLWTVGNVKVAAMEYFGDENGYTSLSSWEYSEPRSRGWFDMHNFNMRTLPDGQLVVIDMGAFGEPENWSY